MYKHLSQRVLSVFIVLALLAQMLPLQLLAAEDTGLTASAPAVSTPAESTDAALSSDDAQIIEEVLSGRTRHTKEFKLSNGLHMAVLYPEPVHYQLDGQWAEIDTTLKATQSGYTTTAGDWQVSLPGTLGTSGTVSVTKDGHTLQFSMAGELRTSGDLSVMSVEDTLSVQAARASTAQPETVDLTAIRAASEHPETISNKLQSRLRYDHVYTGTDIVYDLTPTQLKESIVMESYSQTLRGYRFTLNTGSLTPVLDESGQIGLFSPESKEPVMVMPAPYLIDEAQQISRDVEVTLTGSNGSYTLTYRLPSQWLADQARQWPVVLDPVITVESNALTIEDVAIYQQNFAPNYKEIVLEVGKTTAFGISRSFLKYPDLPALTSSDVVVDATLGLYQIVAASTPYIVEAHKVSGTWTSSTLNWSNQPQINTTVEDFMQVSATGYHHMNITDIVRGWYEGENTGLAITVPKSVEDGSASVNLRGQFYSSDRSIYSSPMVYITFRNNNGLEGYWDYTSASAGRAGTGYMNNYTGNLVWVRSDMGFGGSRMPVSISHIYNANDAALNDFGLGCGWRTNYNQRVYVWSEDSSYYVWEDADGTRHYFYASGSAYADEDGLELTLTVGGTGSQTYCITDKYGNCSYFDASGRLSQQKNNQQTPSTVNITYGTGNQIASITDGAGRVYRFTYSGGLLTRIGYYGKGSKELFYTAYGYTGSQLTTVTDTDGKSSGYTYTTGNLLASAQDIDGYKLTYEYSLISTGKPSRVSKIREYSGSTAGGELTVEYAHNQTSLTDVNGNKQILQFNNWGNTLSVQDGEGRAQYARYASDSGGKANQLSMASRLQNTVGNALYDGSFEHSTLWTATASTVSRSIVTEAAYYGSKSLKLTRSAAGAAAGVYSSSFSVGAGQTYTFSAYVKTGEGAQAYLALHDGSATVTGQTLAQNSGWTRLQVSYTNSTTAAKTVTARLLTETAGTVYMDGAQVEKAPTASRYNLIDNGDFRFGFNGWTNSASAQVTTATAAAPQLSGNVLSIAGGHTQTKRVSQTVNISGSAGDTLILSGWAKGDAAPYYGAYADTRQFSLLLTFTYTDGSTETKTVRFHPDTDSTVSWQYASLPVVAQKAYRSVAVSVAYDYNANTALFDGIQLYREQFGSSYTYDGKGNVTSVKDLQGQTTTYQYEDNDLTRQILPTGAELTYTYDGYHNVKTATTAEGLSYSFTYDAYGNNTQVKITGNGLTMSSSAVYTSDGNRLASVTDALENITRYSYNENTNVLEWVQYPEDSETQRTSYTYDAMFRATQVTSQLSSDTALTVSYGYTNDLLSSVTTGSTTYSFTYGSFALPSAVKIGSRTLASYSYTTDRNFYLSKLTYGNEDSVSYSYDSLGRVVKETYEDGDTVSYSYDNNGALATVTDSATGRTTTYYYDFTDRLMRYEETGSGYAHAVGYTYDNINNLTGLEETINGVTRTTGYTYDDDNRIVGMTVAGSSRTYTYDALGRVSQRVSGMTDGSVVTETFTYTAPSASATSGQVATMRVQGAGLDVTYSYTYDDNGNILTVSDGTKTTRYAYDKANQLIREDNQAGGFTHVWSYDNAGNILSRTEYAYTTGELGTPTDTVNYTYDESWGDLLTAYDGVNISYDGIGNPTGDGTWSYTWEHGRELASMTDGTNTWSFQYDSNGMRTSRTNGTTTYSYVYNGGSLSKMTVGDDTLYFTYGADGHPLTVTHNGTTYFYVTNLQGDVVAILSDDGDIALTYTYDAWGNQLSCTGTMASTLGTLNPLRYRGYVYDHETGLYYLQSRYYDPELGRFLNADAFVSTGQGQLGNNMFAYCNNNPITYTDAAGNWPKLSSIFKAVAVAAVAVVAVAAVVAVVAVAAPAAVAVGGTVISTTAVATAATTVGANALVVTAVSTTAAVVSDKVEKKQSNGYSVYFLEDEYGKIQYVGRVKDSGFDARMRYHYSTRGLVPAKCVSGLSYLEARGLEEIGMIQCHTLNPSNPQNNQIHGIGINNQSGDQYIDAATDYLLNRAENWLLDMIS